MGSRRRMSAWTFRFHPAAPLPSAFRPASRCPSSGRRAPWPNGLTVPWKDASWCVQRGSTAIRIHTGASRSLGSWPREATPATAHTRDSPTTAGMHPSPPPSPCPSQTPARLWPASGTRSRSTTSRWSSPLTAWQWSGRAPWSAARKPAGPRLNPAAHPSTFADSRSPLGG